MDDTNYLSDDWESSPLLDDNMVSQKVSISQQTLVTEVGSTHRKFTQYLAAFIATVGAFAIGMSLGWSSPATVLLEAGEYDFKVTTDDSSWIGSFMPLGAIIGSVITAILVDRIGRKNLILLLIVPVTIGWALMIFAQSVIMFCIGRLLTGVTGGSYCIIIPMYIAEISEKDIRGTLGSYFQLQVTFGILSVYILGKYLSVFWLSVVCGVVPLIYAIPMFFLPESPYFYLKKRNLYEARKSLAWFRGSTYDGEPEITVMQLAVDKDEAEKLPLTKAFTTRAATRGLIIGLGIMFLQQFSGCNAVIFYTTTIFKDAGSSLDRNLSTILVGAVTVVATAIAAVLMDKAGRRLLLLLSIIIMTICTFLLGLYFYLKYDLLKDVTNLGFLPLTSMCVYVFVFSLGFGPIPWLMMGEIFPSRIKSTASSIVCLFNWTCVFFVTKFFSVFSHLIGFALTFWFFTFCTFFGIFFVYFFVPETRNKTLLEIQIMLGESECNINSNETNSHINSSRRSEP